MRVSSIHTSLIVAFFCVSYASTSCSATNAGTDKDHHDNDNKYDEQHKPASAYAYNNKYYGSETKKATQRYENEHDDKHYENRWTEAPTTAWKYTEKPTTTWKWTEAPTTWKYTEKPTTWEPTTWEPTSTWTPAPTTWKYTEKPTTTTWEPTTATWTSTPAPTTWQYTEPPTTTAWAYTEAPTTWQDSDNEHKPCPSHEHKYPATLKAVAVLSSNLGSGVNGTIVFEQSYGQPLKVTGHIFGLKDGLHGWHVHQFGNITGGCDAAGAHFNPYNHTHGAPEDENRHAGDFGNLHAYGSGEDSFTYTDRIATLYGYDSIIGRAIVIHHGTDDLGRGGNAASLANGNSGKRLACAVIGWA
jgi:Cu-Zn family superoxide dismutase